MTTSSTTRPRPADRARRSWYLTRFSLAMQDYPAREYRQIGADLRAGIDAAAADVGMARALADLGTPARLAAGYYGELGRPRPRYWDGAVVAGLFGLLLALCFFSYAAGAADTLLAGGGGVVELTYLGAPMTVTGTSASLSVESQVTWLGVLAFVGSVGLAFALGARCWRLWASRSAVDD
ncbi:hypothetical protein [Pengzhenrongella sicca]|uniref:Uncharacterized protein n=1 Tax=Pengzhenrongella sicca TaxID=2819238 RepID=A0A8A4ZBJ7_9MICO|nr:hypothetical protein [Pengzhenrongella sicca]QTE29282.1 hypothetical protein J4E96_18725 [Pengzhenrongella sicca]